MTVSLAAVDQEFRNAVLGAGNNARVVFFHPDGPRPLMPYTSIQRLSVSEEINDWDEFDKVEDLNRHYGYRDVTYTINTFGDGARQEASVLQGAIRKQTIRDSLRSVIEAAIISMTPINDLTALIDSDYEERASFDITLSVLVEDGTTTDDTGYFDSYDPTWTNKP